MEKDLKNKKTSNNLNIIITCVVGIAGLLIGYFGRGWIEPLLITPNRVVEKVNGHSITMKEFQSFAKFYRIQEINTYQQLQQYVSLYQQYGMTPDSSLTSQVTAIQQEFSSSTVLGQKVLDLLTENRLIEEKAKELGVTVTDDEVTKLMQDSFGYYPKGNPTKAPTATLYVTPTYSATQIALLATPTSAPTATSTPVPASEVTEIPTVEIPIATTTSAPTYAPTPTLAPTSIPPTATLMSLDTYQTNLKDYLTSNLTPYGLTESDLRDFLYYNLLYNKVYTELTKDIPTHGEQVWVRHILVTTQEAAQQILDELNKGGNWLELAYNNNIDTNTQNSGGDMGWLPRGYLSSELEAAAFSMQIGETRIVQDVNGYHVLQITGHEQDRPVSSNIYQQMQSIMFNKWLSSAKTDAVITTNDIWKRYVPTEPELYSSSSTVAQ